MIRLFLIVMQPVYCYHTSRCLQRAKENDRNAGRTFLTLILPFITMGQVIRNTLAHVLRYLKDSIDNEPDRT